MASNVVTTLNDHCSEFVNIADIVRPPSLDPRSSGWDCACLNLKQAESMSCRMRSKPGKNPGQHHTSIVMPSWSRCAINGCEAKDGPTQRRAFESSGGNGRSAIDCTYA
jgi:hypothetical protein